MLTAVINFGKALMPKGLAWVNQKLQALSRPLDDTTLLATVSDLLHPRSELILENALLRQQVIVLRRNVKRPKLRSTDRRIWVLLASRLRVWRSARRYDLVHPHPIRLSGRSTA
jgi:hypothetical protein